MERLSFGSDDSGQGGEGEKTLGINGSIPAFTWFPDAEFASCRALEVRQS